MTNREIVLAHEALKAIAPLKKAPKGTYALAKNCAIFSEAVKPIEEANRALWKEKFGEATTVDAKHPKWMEYQEAVRVLDNTQTEIEPYRFRQADLNLGENEIDHEHLAAIRFLIEDW